MTQEEKELLLKDLCARLPYGLRVQYYYQVAGTGQITEGVLSFEKMFDFSSKKDYHERKIVTIIPYLRPMSSMTREEEAYWNYHRHMVGDGICTLGYDNPTFCIFECFEWLNSHHFDYGGLIIKGLALEAPEGMYKVD